MRVHVLQAFAFSRPIGELLDAVQPKMSEAAYEEMVTAIAQVHGIEFDAAAAEGDGVDDRGLMRLSGVGG